jgi:hypothetical protein
MAPLLKVQLLKVLRHHPKPGANLRCAVLAIVNVHIGLGQFRDQKDLLCF